MIGPHRAFPRAAPDRSCNSARVDDQERLEYFARMVREAPEVARVRCAYANELLRAERLDDAVVELRSYLSLSEDEGNAWGRLGDALARLGRPDEAADAYLAGIDQAERHGHTGMADEFRDAIERL